MSGAARSLAVLRGVLRLKSRLVFRAILNPSQFECAEQMAAIEFPVSEIDKVVRLCLFPSARTPLLSLAAPLMLVFGLFRPPTDHQSPPKSLVSRFSGTAYPDV